MKYLLILMITVTLFLSCSHIVNVSGTCVKKMRDGDLGTKYLFLSPDSNEIIVRRSFKKNLYEVDSFYSFKVNRGSIYTHIKRSIFSPKKPIKK